MNIYKRLCLFILFICLIVAGFSQIKIPIDSTRKYFKKEGVVFEKGSEINFIIPSMSQRFSPEVQDILLAENIFLKKYNEVMSSDSTVIGLVRPINVKKKYCDYARQYLGFIDTNGHKNILVHLLNFKIKETDKEKYFRNWDKEFGTGSGSFFEVNTITFAINIDLFKMSFQW